MKTLEDNKIYRLDHDGFISVAFMENRDDTSVLVFDTHRGHNVAGYTVVETEDGLRYEAGDSYFEFSPLTLETAHEIFPNTVRVFKDLAVLETFARREIDMADSYEENVAPEETISFTVSDQDQVLALIKVTDTGDMFYWNQDDWTQVQEDDELPNIYDQEVIDVEPSDIGTALQLWKDAIATAKPLTKEDILVYAALKQ
jgi:hypothetical protein